MTFHATPDPYECDTCHARATIMTTIEQRWFERKGYLTSTQHFCSLGCLLVAVEDDDRICECCKAQPKEVV